MKRKQSTFHLSRHFSVTSFIAISLTAFLIFLFFRYETIKSIEQTSKKSSTALTVVLQDTLNDHLIRFLDQNWNITSGSDEILKPDPVLLGVLNKLLRSTEVERIKIYDVEGRVLYSTKSSQIGGNQENNPGFKTAMTGGTLSYLIYHDDFNFLDQESEEDNLVQTYIPIRDNRQEMGGPVLGVLESYTDIQTAVNQLSRANIVTWFIVTVSMLVLFFFLMFVIRRAEATIKAQNMESTERKHLLEVLSAKMINAQEDEKRRIAFELHEDVVQTLAGIKMQLEGFLQRLRQFSDERSSAIGRETETIVPLLQEGVRRIRSVAMDLRPPSLDDFGLSVSVKSLISACTEQVTSIAIYLDFRLELDEEQLSDQERTLLFRTIKELLNTFCHNAMADSEMIMLVTEKSGDLVLKIRIVSTGESPYSEEHVHLYFDSMKNRTILSGGGFSILEMADTFIEAESRWERFIS